MECQFENIMFLTSFCCMACDGEIAPEEVGVLKTLSDEEHLFGSLNINDKFNESIDKLKATGNTFMKSYFDMISNLNLEDGQKIAILDLTVKTMYADKKVDYSEIKFFKSLFRSLNVERQFVLDNVENIDEYWLEDDLSGSSLFYDFFDRCTDVIKIPANLNL